MVSVVGKELVPYDANLRHASSSPSTSSIVIDSSPQTDEEDLMMSLQPSDCASNSDSDMFALDSGTDKPLAITYHSGLKNVSPSSVQDVLEDHKKFPPQHSLGDSEDIPATREKLDYFLRVLKLKVAKYHSFSFGKIPPSLRSIPLALSYETFIRFYWPGALSCCDKLYKSSQSYSTHYYNMHAQQKTTSSSPLSITCLSDNEERGKANKLASSASFSELAMADAESDSSDVVSLPDDTRSKSFPSKPSTTQRKSYTDQASRSSLPSTSNESSKGSARKRKALSPSSRPGPLSRKQPKLNLTLSAIDSSLDSGDEKSVNRPKRVRKRHFSHDSFDERNEQFIDELNADQIRYKPQHEPGAPENFVASASRLSYFSEVLTLKLKKYPTLNSHRPTSPSRHIPLALNLSGFMQYYWPGKVACCSKIRETIQELEDHIVKFHRPPKRLPKLSLISVPTQNNDSEDTDALDPSQIAKADTPLPEKSPAKSTTNFQADQHKFPPQHKPGEPEDFLANQESIDYFMQAFRLKREKYSKMSPIKDKPLSSLYPDFVANYWPGMMACCSRLYMTCREFQVHLTSCHLAHKKLPQLTVVDASAIPTTSECQNMSSSSERKRSGSPRSFRPSPGGGWSSRQNIEQATPHGDSQQQQALSVLSAPPQLLMINSIHDEARHLRTQTTQVPNLPKLLPILERILELSASITNRIRGTIEVEARSHAIECLEYVWNAFKTAIVRWEDLKGRSNRDPFLSAIQYAYGSLPVFTTWEQSKHLEMLENVILLCLNTVKNWQPSPSSPESKAERGANRSNAVRRRTFKQTRLDTSTPVHLDPERMETAGGSPSIGTPILRAVSPNPLKDSKTKKMDVAEFCRLANISLWQNTKSRPGYKDDDGQYHPMYRYGIGQMLNLFRPPDITHLKCCDRVLDMTQFREHVLTKHEGSNRTEPSISPA